MLLENVVLWLHILSAVTWIGGMVFNLFVVRPSLAIVSAGERVKLVLAILRRFISQVWLCIIILVLSGIYLAAIRIGSIDALIASAYGQGLLLKATIMVVMVSIVAYIRYNRLPLLETLGESQKIGHVLPGVVSLVKLNLALGVFVLLLSSIMVGL